VAFRIVLNAGDEAVISEPAWFCSEPMLLAADAVPRKVKLKLPTFDLDLSAIEAAIGPKTQYTEGIGRTSGTRVREIRASRVFALGRTISSPAL
jgi:dTDP-4-amino-4,6-dideoxygalactose transaminase